MTLKCSSLVQTRRTSRILCAANNVRRSPVHQPRRVISHWSSIHRYLSIRYSSRSFAHTSRHHASWVTADQRTLSLKGLAICEYELSTSNPLPVVTLHTPCTPLEKKPMKRHRSNDPPRIQNIQTPRVCFSRRLSLSRMHDVQS